MKLANVWIEFKDKVTLRVAENVIPKGNKGCVLNAEEFLMH